MGNLFTYALLSDELELENEELLKLELENDELLLLENDELLLLENDELLLLENDELLLENDELENDELENDELLKLELENEELEKLLLELEKLELELLELELWPGRRQISQVVDTLSNARIAQRYILSRLETTAPKLSPICPLATLFWKPLSNMTRGTTSSMLISI